LLFYSQALTLAMAFVQAWTLERAEDVAAKKAAMQNAIKTWLKLSDK